MKRTGGTWAIAWGLALGLGVTIGCAGGGARRAGGQGGDAGSGGDSGEGGAGGGSGGRMSGSGGRGGSEGAPVPRDAAAAPEPGRGDAGAGVDASATDAVTADALRSDLGPPSAAPTVWGGAGQVCCGGNTCMGGRPVITRGAPVETTVLHLRASGRDPYAYFGAMKLLPIDGPDAGYITDTGTSFLFVLHENGAEETVSSGALRQRNEVTVNPGNPTIYKALQGDTVTYAWRFRLDRVNAVPTWTDIFQVKQHGTTGTGPYMAFEADKASFNVKTARSGIVRTIPLATLMGVWIDARVTMKFDVAGPTTVTLTKVDDGAPVLSYSGVLQLWDTTIDFVRPKWGFYRNKRAGAGEAAIHYNDMRIIRHFPDGPCACAP